MTGVIKQPDIRSLKLPSEISHSVVKRSLVQVDLRFTSNDREAKAAQRVGHKKSVAGSRATF